MKVEVGSFAANSSSVTVLLNDSTLTVKGIVFLNSGSTVSGKVVTGFTDGTTNRSGSPRSTTYCVQAYGGTTQKVAGKSVSGSFSTPGEFTLAFDKFDAAYPIDFMVYGD